MKKLSIIIVHYKVKENTFQCIMSIYKNKPNCSFEIIVIDNDEKEKIRKEIKNKFPKVKYLKSPGNIGYSRAINKAAKTASSEYLLILNSDIIVLDTSLNKLISFIDKNTEIGIVGPLLLNKVDKLYTQLETKLLTPTYAVKKLSFLNRLFPTKEKLRIGNKPSRTEVIPGSILLIRKKVFDTVKGFDENFFLYFEESDFCKRVIEKGWKIYLIPGAKVVHLWKANTPRSKKIKKIFEQSRYYYFKKHYGKLNALVVELFARFSKWHALLILILMLGTILRFYHLPQNLVFHGELGHNYLAIKNFIAQKQIPLIGPSTSHPWLSFGPLFYWLLAPILLLGKYEPISGAYFFAFLGVITILINFFTIKKIIGPRTASISSFILAISPLWLDLTRESRFFSIVAILAYPLLYLILKIQKGETRYSFVVGLLFGIMLNFHLSPLFLIILILLTFYKQRRIFTKKKTFEFLAGFILPNIPFLIYDAMHRFKMISQLLLWIPYRVLSSLGLYKIASVTITNAQTPETIFSFVTKTFVNPNIWIAPIIFILFCISCIVLVIKVSKKKKVVLNTLFVWFIIGVVSLIVHGNPPSHYFVPLYPIPLIIFSYFLAKYVKKSLLIICLALLFLINMQFFFSEKWFYKPNSKVMADSVVPYSLQTEAVKTILEDAQGKAWNLKRIGYSDQFEGYYAQNYRYLAWLFGNEPTDKKTKITYTIVEKIPNIEIIKEISK